MIVFTDEQLQRLAERQPRGNEVCLTTAERDALVALAKEALQNRKQQENQ